MKIGLSTITIGLFFLLFGFGFMLPLVLDGLGIINICDWWRGIC